MNVEIPGQGKVIGFYGKEAQMLVHCGELAEMIQAITKIHRIGCGPDVPPDAYENLVEDCDHCPYRYSTEDAVSDEADREYDDYRDSLDF